MTDIMFFVPGIPVGQGNMAAVGGRVFHKSSTGLHAWRDAIRNDAAASCSDLLEGAVGLTLTFRLPKPRSTPRKVLWPTKRPDIDKLARAAMDALTGVAFGDDSQVVHLQCLKTYAGAGQQPGVLVRLTLEE